MGRGKIDIEALECALTGKPWAFSGLLHGIDDVMDDEGRPLGERRASSRAKDGVDIELKACPYPDLRRDQPMNLSAFRQVMVHLQPTLADIARFQAALPAVHDGYWRILLSVIDQLAQPATLLLTAKDPGEPIPAPVAVGYKLAAGFFSGINATIAEPVAPSPDTYARALLEHVAEHRLLVGASEVCAGPMNLIEKAAVAFAAPNDEAAPCEEARVTRATLLGAQLRLGMFLRTHDLATEVWLLREMGEEVLRPRNAYMERALMTRRQELGPGSHPRPTLDGLLPPHVAPDIMRDLHVRLGDHAQAQAVGRWLTTLEAATDFVEDTALRVAEGHRGAVLREVARYLGLRAAVVRAQWRLEMELRATFGRDLGSSLAPNGLILPQGGAKRWLDALLGHRIEMELSEKPGLALKNHRRTLPLDPLAA